MKRLFLYMVVAVVALFGASQAALSLENLCVDRASCMDFVDNLPVYVKLAGLGHKINVDFLQETLYGILNARPESEDPTLLQTSGVGSDVDKKWCPSNSYYEFLPVHMADILSSGKTATWESSCYHSVTATLTGTATTGGTITITPGQVKTVGCNDLYLLSTGFKMRPVDLSSAKSGPVTVTVPAWEQHEWKDIQLHGIRVLLMPCGILGSITSALKTVGLFVGDDIVEHNVDFLVERKVLPPLQMHGKNQTIDASMIRSGDYLGVMRLDGLDPLVMWGTGGRTGHAVFCVWEGNQLYVLESTDANPFGKVYWPPPYGIVKHKYEEWIELAHKAEYHVALLPLDRATWSQRFDENAFWQWYNQVEGMPYGMATFLLCFLDTYPMRNLPEPIDNAVMTWLIAGLDKLLPAPPPGKDTNGFSVYTIMTQAVDKRLNLTCRSMECAIAAMNDLGTTLGEVTAIPERDTWMYNGNYSMTCSMFVMEGWKAGFYAHDPWPHITGTEQTPKDNYQMAIYDRTYFNEQNCPNGLVKTPTGNYCQLMGKYVLPLNDFNTIPPYAGMNNKCPSQWPSYERCPPNNPMCC